MSKVEEIIAQLETLTPDERAIVADAALAPFRQPDPEVMEAWKSEALCRLDEVRSGKVTTIPGEIVLEQLRERYRP